MAESLASSRPGRPRLPGHVKYIRLWSSVFDLWREMKKDLKVELRCAIVDRLLAIGVWFIQLIRILNER